MNVLLLNAGSSSLKFSLLDANDRKILARGSVDWAGQSTHYQFTGLNRHADEKVSWRGAGPAVERACHDIEGTDIAAVGHRIVHGGDNTRALRVTDAVRGELARLSDLAPLHNPPSLEVLAAATKHWPNVPHVATFDTTFHTTIPAAARTYPIPARWTNEWGLRRYGFHGLSHAYSTRRAGEMLGRHPDELRLVICHLGHGCSASAVDRGRCVDTTMGYTPLDGLMMGTRSGAVDPSILIQVQRHHGLSVDQVEQALLRESGLLGVSGVSADMRSVLAAAVNGNAQAGLAIDLYVHRVRQAIGALAVPMGRLDVLVFTAGVGENASVIRSQVCRTLGWLGVILDEDLNRSARPDHDIAAASSRARILIIEAREDLSMLHEVLETLRRT
jgi:acetate kinase